MFKLSLSYDHMKCYREILKRGSLILMMGVFFFPYAQGAWYTLVEDIERLEASLKVHLQKEKTLLQEGDRYRESIKGQKGKYYKNKGILLQLRIEKSMRQYRKILKAVNVSRKERIEIEIQLREKREKLEKEIWKNFEIKLKKLHQAVDVDQRQEALSALREMRSILSQMPEQDVNMGYESYLNESLEWILDNRESEMIGILLQHELERTDRIIEQIENDMDRIKRELNAYKSLNRFQGLSVRQTEAGPIYSHKQVSLTEKMKRLEQLFERATERKNQIEMILKQMEVS